METLLFFQVLLKPTITHKAVVIMPSLSPSLWLLWLISLRPTDLAFIQIHGQQNIGEWPHHDQENCQATLEDNMETLNFLKTLRNSVGFSQILLQMSQILQQQGKYSMAQQCAELALFQLRRKSQNDVNLRNDYAVALHQLGCIHYHQGRHRIAIKMLERCIAVRQELKDPTGEAISFVVMGQAYVARQQYLLALACCEAALEICCEQAAQFEDSWIAVEAQSLMAGIYENCGHLNLALTHYLRAFDLGRKV